MIWQLIAVLVLGTVQNPASTPAESPATAPPAKAPDEITVTGERYQENRRVCVSSVPTGSIMKKKVCKTAGQWAQEKAAGKRALDRLLAHQALEQLRLARCMRGASPDC